MPPNLGDPVPGAPEGTGYDKAKYTAIGESDRMTLRFRKPVPAAARKAGMARNPFTGEMVKVDARPASLSVRAAAMKAIKDVVA